MSAAKNKAAQGNLTESLELLIQHLQSNRSDVQTWHQASLLAEQTDQSTLAGFAHRQCISLAPNLAIAYIYAGHWLNNQNDLESAASAYSLAYDLQPERFLSPSNYSNNQVTFDRTVSGGKVLSSFLREKHQLSCGSSEKVREARWVRTDAADITLPKMTLDTTKSCPELFKIDKVRQQPFYETIDFEWATQLIDSKEDILDELRLFLNSEELAKSARPYLSAQEVTQGPLSDLAGSTNWKAIDLYRNGERSRIAERSFSKTENLLKNVPLYALSEHPFEVFFSLLKPGQEIAPHYGQSNHSLTVHLPLIVCNQGYLEVAGEQRKWSENELIVFDDSFLHSAHNVGDLDRVVLIFSIWHPDLNQADQDAIRSSFNSRAEWLDQRYNKTLEALPKSMPD